MTDETFPDNLPSSNSASIGPYRIQRTIETVKEAGGTSMVYAANRESDTATDALVFLTIFNPESDDAARQWAVHFRAVRALQHPNIMPFIDGGKTEDGRLYVTSPLYLPYLTKNNALSAEAAIAFSQQVSAALDYAHAHGIVHGHLTRAHILRAAENHLVVRGFESSGRVTSDQLPAQKVRDIAALARLVFQALGAAKLADLPAPVADVLRRTLNAPKNMIEFPSAAAFHTALTHAISAPIVAERTLGNRRGRVIRVLALSALILFATIAILLARRLPEESPQVAVLPSDTPSFTPSRTDTPTDTPIPTNTYVPTKTPLPTFTPTPLPTNTLLPTITDTPTPLPTATTPPTRTLSPTPLPTDTPVPTATATIDYIAKYTNPCVSLVGDSVTHGGSVFEVPAQGYVFALTEPVAQFVQERLKQVGIDNIKGIDRGASNTGISTSNHPSYFNTNAYQGLLTDHCRYTVIMPWINDITPPISQDIAAPRHIEILSNLITSLATNNPLGRIIVLNYYTGVVSPFAANTWAAGFNSDGIALYNGLIAQACITGKLSKLPQVYCANMEDAFTDVAPAHVIGQTTKEELFSIIIQPIIPQEMDFLNYYYSISPNGLILGDGVHLSRVGKTALAAFIVQVMQSLPPVLVPATFQTPQG